MDVPGKMTVNTLLLKPRVHKHATACGDGIDVKIAFLCGTDTAGQENVASEENCRCANAGDKSGKRWSEKFHRQRDPCARPRPILTTPDWQCSDASNLCDQEINLDSVLQTCRNWKFSYLLRPAKAILNKRDYPQREMQMPTGRNQRR